MFRQTDNRKVWYEWMVEVFRLERTSTAGGGISSPQRSSTPIMMSGANRAAANASSAGNNTQKQANINNANNDNKGYRRIRVGMSEMHSSIKEGCLM